MIDTDIADLLEQAKDVIDQVYYATCKTEKPWFINKLTTISLLLDELTQGE